MESNERRGERTGRKTFSTRVSCSAANTMHVSDRAVCREIVGRRAHNWTGYRVSRRRRNFDQRIYDIYIHIRDEKFKWTRSNR